eukprot:3344039-Pleurochrysis_carterae.AAC.1
MQSASVVISTLRRSDTGPSSSKFHRSDSADEEVVDVAPNNDRLSDVIYGHEPREERALPPAARLCHAVNRLDNAADAGLAILSQGFVARWGVAVYDFARFEFALQVGGYEVPPAHGQPSLGRQ